MVWKTTGSVAITYLVGLVFLTARLPSLCCAGEVTRDVDFNRRVHPILSDKCFRCHGPDEGQRQAGLRLDKRESAIAELESGCRAIVPGRPDESELVARINSDDPDIRMPPSDSNKSLSNSERDVLRAWIAAGAHYAPHWSFIPPVAPQPPVLTEDSWSHNEIDRFILSRLRSEGLTPSPEADRRTLIRRVSFDLTGLPPTIEEVQSFLNDQSPDAYEKVVDRLLQSPRYGERMASHWLDLARYADTDGYEKDSHRQMWPYRDWVIQAYNHNMPFDQFTIEQLAGDSFPNAQQSQLIASAFNRNNPTTSEGGADPDEYAAKYAIDRATTTSTVWLGLTLQCAECHDHKFDPLSTKDFYKLFAFFNQIPEQPLYEGAAAPPSIPVPTAEQSKAYTALDKQLAALRQKYTALAGEPAEKPDIRDGLLAEYSFDEPNGEISNDTSGNNHQARITFANVSGNSSPERVNTPLSRGLMFRGGGTMTCGGSWDFSQSAGIAYGAWVKPTDEGGVVLSKIDPANASRGFDLYMQEGHATAHIVDAWPDAALKVSTVDTYENDKWTHVFVVWNGGSQADSVQIYFNGNHQQLRIDNHSGTIEDLGNEDALLIGARDSEESPLHGMVDEVRIYDRALTEQEVQDLVAHSAGRISKTPPTKRTWDQALFLAECYRNTGDGSEASQCRLNIAIAEAEQAHLREVIPQVRVMRQIEEPRPTFVLVRGDYRNRGEEVTADIPALFGGLHRDGNLNRLTLAEWIVSSDNPLTARVTVNRLWALCFGRGIVSTLNDFGSQGAWPTHPELLDWLATDFVTNNWDIKAIIRKIVTSSTYRQSSNAGQALQTADPDNTLLARGPRFRLPAEMLRDNALFVSGLLEEQVGGPSVFPYHPAGLWEEMAWADSPWKSWIQDHGRDLYRRGLYTFWKRSLLHPVFSIFDAPARNVCEVQRPVTNTPLQAFVTLNEPSFVEAARVLAERVLLNNPEDDSARIGEFYLRVLSRPPIAKETEALLNLASQSRMRYQKHPDLAEKFLAVGEARRSPQLSPVELAAWTTVAQAIFNLDETMTKE